MGNLSLRALDYREERWLDLDSGAGLGARLGLMEGESGPHRMGPAATCYTL